MLSWLILPLLASEKQVHFFKITIFRNLWSTFRLSGSGLWIAGALRTQNQYLEQLTYSVECFWPYGLSFVLLWKARARIFKEFLDLQLLGTYTYLVLTINCHWLGRLSKITNYNQQKKSTGNVALRLLLRSAIGSNCSEKSTLDHALYWIYGDSPAFEKWSM